MNRVIVILRYIYNLAKKWKVAGVSDNPAAGLSAGPDVQRNRFLTEEEAEALVRALHVDENQVAARAIMLDGATLTDISYHLLALAAMSGIFLALGAALFKWTQD